MVLRNNPDEMISLLSSLCDLTQKNPSSFYEVSFANNFSSLMKQGRTWLDKYKNERKESQLSALWHFFSQIFYSVRNVIKALKKVDINDASTFLSAFSDTEIPVPGCYKPNSSMIGIAGFGKVLHVIESQQRPRKMRMIGSDGNSYAFLLKGHEDVRLDERVMQLFSFLNTILNSKLITYKVVPITGEVGLIGWVGECSTIYGLVKSYRERKGIELECEFNHVYAAFPNYEKLPLDEKVKAFKSGYTAGNGMDLRDVLFWNSADSADWIERRLHYSISLANTSLSGYILGLGDRHMCNIMMKLKTAELVHIDFGDCFEVAMLRDRFPEKVPFRLTRLLLNSLEVSGIRGTFFSTCIDVMKTVRDNKEHILGILEVFGCDPLKNWGGDATRMLDRIKQKLDGNDFEGESELSVEKQTEKLVEQAMDDLNLCQMFKGWYPWW
jgi:FKBP12-rapamycin complex-associated protein